MKERLVTLALAVGALALFYALFVPKPASDADAVPLPVSTEGGDAGYQAAWRWLQSQDIPVVSFRDRYSALDQQPLAPGGNLLITTLPHQAPARDDEAARLAAWLQRGNTLLVMVALNDTPPWAVGASRAFLNTLARLSGLHFGPVREPGDGPEVAGTIRQAVQQLLDPRREKIIPLGSHALLEGIDAVSTRSEYPASRWSLRGNNTLALELARRADSDNLLAEPAMWLLSRDQGQIIVMAYASPLSNAVIGEPDNARLLANILAWSLAADGAVLFDDAHQGLVSFYDARAFFADPRLHRTLLWLALLWLLFVLGWQRLRPGADGWQPADVTGFIKVTGDFLAGRIAPDQAGQRLFANFFNTIRQRLGLPQDGQPVWDWLAAHAGVPDEDLQALRHLHARAHTGQRIDLVHLQNCLTKTAGRLT